MTVIEYLVIYYTALRVRVAFTEKMPLPTLLLVGCNPSALVGICGKVAKLEVGTK